MDPHISSSIIRGKTVAWASPEAVAVYEKAMDGTTGSILLKNTIEPLLIGRHTVGQRILDVGIGTGRASLPLLERGLEVTGVDSSQAMLDATRRRAGERPISLIPGDVTALPFADASFDGIVSLNVTTHFPHWQAIMAEWARVIRPGGRMVFDLLSADHGDTVLETTGVRLPPPDPGGSYQLQVRASELIPEFNRLGLRVAGVYPYGMISNNIAATAWLTGTLADGLLWERVLTYVTVDRSLFDMLVYIEEAIVGRLGTDATGRYMIVLEKTQDPEANARWLAANDRMAQALRAGFSRASVGAIVGEAVWEGWRKALGAFLAHPPNLVAFFRLYDMAIAHRYPVALEELVTHEQAAGLRSLEMRRRAESAVWDFVTRLSAHPQIGPLLRPRADIESGLEWKFIANLDAHLHERLA